MYSWDTFTHVYNAQKKYKSRLAVLLFLKRFRQRLLFYNIPERKCSVGLCWVCDASAETSWLSRLTWRNWSNILHKNTIVLLIYATHKHYITTSNDLCVSGKRIHHLKLSRALLEEPQTSVSVCVMCVVCDSLCLMCDSLCITVFF